MASKSITVLKTETDVLIATNGARAITAALHNVLLNDILDSSLNRISDAALVGLNDFDTSTTYPEGRAVMYDDGGGVDIYRANTANGPSAFDPLEWDVVAGGGNTLYTSDDILAGNRIVGGAGYTLSLGTILDPLSSFTAYTEDANIDIYANNSASSAAYSRLSLEYQGTSSLIARNSSSALSTLELKDTGVWSVDSRQNSSNKSLTKYTGSTGVFEITNTRDNFSTSYGVIFDAVTNISSKMYYHDSSIENSPTLGTIIKDPTSGLGLSCNDYTVDEANRVWATDDDWIPTVGSIKANVGMSVTNDYIPIGNAGSTGIEDSPFSVTVGVDGTGSNYFQRILGNNINTGVTATSITSVRLGHANAVMSQMYLDMSYVPDNGEASGALITNTLQTTNDLVYTQVDNEVEQGPNEYRTHRFSVSGSTMFQIYNDIETNLAAPLVEVNNNSMFSVLGETDVRSIFLADGINQRVQIGRHNPFNNTLSTNGAYLTIESFEANTAWDSNIPHFQLVGGIDETLATLTGNEFWVSANDSKAYFTNHNLTNIPLEGLKSVINNTQASVATLTADSDVSDLEVLTAQGAALTIAAPTGTPVDGQKLVYKIKDNSTTKALTWNAIFQVIGTTLPTATTGGKWHRIECEYNVTDTKWDVIAVSVQA